MFLDRLVQKMRQVFQKKEKPIPPEYDKDGEELLIGPNKEHPYMTVFLSKSHRRFGMRLRCNGYRPIIYLDTKAIPELVDALVELKKRVADDDAK